MGKGSSCLSKDYKHIRTALFPFGDVIKNSDGDWSVPFSWVLNEIYGPNGFPLTHNLFLSLTFPLNQTISIVSQISHKLSDLIYIYINKYIIIIRASYSRLSCYGKICYWILWLLWKKKTTIITTVVTHNQLCIHNGSSSVFWKQSFFSKSPIWKSY